MLEAQFGLAQTPAYIQKIAWLGTGTQDCATRSRLADDGDVDQDLFAPRGISASHKALKSTGRAPQPAEKLFQPLSGKGCRESKAEKKAARSAPHGGNVANGPSKALPAHTIGRMLIAKEMRAFQEPVASQNRLVARPRAEKRGIIADT
jgi:hypothetical protein